MDSFQNIIIGQVRTYLFTYLSTFLFIYLIIYLFIYLFVYLFIYLFKVDLYLTWLVSTLDICTGPWYSPQSESTKLFLRHSGRLLKVLLYTKFTPCVQGANKYTKCTYIYINTEIWKKNTLSKFWYIFFQCSHKAPRSPAQIVIR